MVRDDSTRPGLFPVVQVTFVSSAESTGQLIPSMVILYKVISVLNLSPVKVTSVPP